MIPILASTRRSAVNCSSARRFPVDRRRSGDEGLVQSLHRATIIDLMAQRVRQRVGTSDAECGVCGGHPLHLIESRGTRPVLAWLNHRWDPQVRSYEYCPSCGAKYRLENGRRV